MRAPTKPKPGYIEIRDSRTQKLVCRYNPTTREVEVLQRGDVRRGSLPADLPRIEQYVALTQGENDTP